MEVLTNEPTMLRSIVGSYTCLLALAFFGAMYYIKHYLYARRKLHGYTQVETDEYDPYELQEEIEPKHHSSSRSWIGWKSKDR